MQGGANVKSAGVSNTCLFALAPYYKLNKGFFLGFLFKPRGGLRPPCGFKQESLGKVSFIYYITALGSLYSDKYQIKQAHTEESR